MARDGWRFAEARSLLDEWNRRAIEARPFLKWAGGKRLFLTRHANLISVPRGRYIEPFLGSGAVFFHVCRVAERPVPSQLGDANGALVESYLQVQEDPEIVAETLEMLVAGFTAAKDKRAFYERQREDYNRALPRVDAAYFIFLNRTCWNGLYRINQKGFFNVPMGTVSDSRRVRFPNKESLVDAAIALSSARLRSTPWQNSLALADPGDFVFLDPPYYSDVIREDIKYSGKMFSLDDHILLADACRALADRGIDFVLTNSAEKVMRQLYAERGLFVTVVSIPRAINSDTANRSGVRELVVTPHPI